MAKNYYIQKRFFTTSRGDSLIAILIILLVTLGIPRLLGSVWLTGLAGQALAFAIIPYFVLHYTVDATLKYNQLLVYALVYPIVFLLMVGINIR